MIDMPLFITPMMKAPMTAPTTLPTPPVVAAPPNYSGSLTVTSACKVSGIASGIAFKGRTDPIPGNSALKPTLLVGASTNGDIAFTGFKQ